MGGAGGLTCCKEEKPAAEDLVLSPAQSVVLEAEIVRPMAGLGKFEHDSAAVVGVAADDRQAVVVFGDLSVQAGSLAFPEIVVI